MRLNLLPQEHRFFDLIEESGELAYRSVYLLKNGVCETDLERQRQLSAELLGVKRRAKKVSSELTEKLSKTFVTPLDREDIQALATSMYKIPKITEKTLSRMYAFKLQPFDGDFMKLTANMADAADQLAVLMKNMNIAKNLEVTRAQFEQLTDVEGRTDDLLNSLLVYLFEHESDVKQVILRRDIYDLMESIVDRHRDIGGIMLDIVLKNS